MSSSNHVSPLPFDDQTYRYRPISGRRSLKDRILLEIHRYEDDHPENFLENVPRKPRSTLQPQPQPKPELLQQHQRRNPKMALRRSDNEAESKEIPTLTKILIGTCLAAILTPQITTHSMSAKLEIIIQWIALLSMMVGMYVQSKWPKLSIWLQRLGHLNCLVGLMVMQAPLLQLDVTYVWIPPFVVALILGTTMLWLS